MNLSDFNYCYLNNIYRTKDVVAFELALADKLFKHCAIYLVDSEHLIEIEKMDDLIKDFKIVDTILHNRIEEMRAKTEMSYSDFLYSQLGYKKIEHGPLAKLSFEELSEVRALYITRQNKELAKMLDVKETGNINSMFKDAGIPILSYRLEDWKMDPKYEEIVKLLSFYYKNDTNLFCVINNRPLPMFYSLEVLTTKSVNAELNKNASLAKHDTKCVEIVLAIDAKYKESLGRVMQRKDFISYNLELIEENSDMRKAFNNMPIPLKITKKVVGGDD